ncbi:MAG: hypothetical protein F6K50_52475 [Moorea sp. SIO3I7]|uniref:Uncharacterized protein n=1 Tax=Moorena bouillonii PNG TaxID=568701 RepID=A0A1U7MYM1_9CYAN|nr:MULTISPECIES: hypothetical protein [Moorena]NEO03610.1 hypothetical protein [Moorena sp. SIO3I7]NEO65790.1 hypothetical protein [Moorena sp. SIO4G2]NEO09041.1 hypothetical protein [Moorena sp. SIO3I8]NEP26852.1 hypothetical protein [Moorena sp. SIO3I6]OLT58807.1 hypothetical protein BJP37_06860 [Moorena bouillonii PNG]
MTPIELRQKGYYALVKELAQVDAIRFLQDVGLGFGDYTQEPQQSLKNVTRSDFWQDIQEIRAKKDLDNQ